MYKKEQRAKKSQNTPKEEKEVRVTLPDVNSYCRVIIIKTAILGEESNGEKVADWDYIRQQEIS